MMKVYIGMIAYDEEILIEAAIRSVYDYVDKVVVIDGSPFGPSSDRTAEIASLIGPKVKLVSGTFKNLGSGRDHKVWQRREYLKHMTRDKDNWCIAHDADEVFNVENLQRLLDHLKTASHKTGLFGYENLNFYRDCWHYRGGHPTRTRAFRLIPGITYLAHNNVGIPKVTNWSQSQAPTFIFLNDVRVHHYGHAQTYKKAEAKAKFYLTRGDCRKGGYDVNEWERYKRENFLPRWREGVNRKGVKVFKGEHPTAIQPVIDNFWKLGKEKL